MSTLLTHLHAHTLAHTLCLCSCVFVRLSPEFYDSIIRLPIPISSGVLMMIGVLPMHPSPHGSFARVVGGWDRGWVVWLISCLGEMGYVCRIGGCVDLGHYYESRTVLCIHKAIPLYSISM